MSLEPEAAAGLVSRATEGDQEAWDSLVDAYSGLIWTVARNHRLDARDAADVSQTTWLRLVEHIDRLSEPGRVGAWLVTTARRESLRVVGHVRRVVLVPEQTDLEAAEARSFEDDVDSALLRAEREQALREALDALPARHQQLMRMLMADPAPSYEEISAALDMPVGSIGPTRMRCLSRLRGLVNVTDSELTAAG